MMSQVMESQIQILEQLGMDLTMGFLRVLEMMNLQSL